MSKDAISFLFNLKIDLQKNIYQSNIKDFYKNLGGLTK